MWLWTSGLHERWRISCSLLNEKSCLETYICFWVTVLLSEINIKISARNIYFLLSNLWYNVKIFCQCHLQCRMSFYISCCNLLFQPARNLTCIIVLVSFLFSKSSESLWIADVFAFLFKISRLSLSLSLSPSSALFILLICLNKNATSSWHFFWIFFALWIFASGFVLTEFFLYSFPSSFFELTDLVSFKWERTI